MLKIKLPKKLESSVKNSELKAINLINFLVNDNHAAPDKTDLNKVSLNDLTFYELDNRKAKHIEIDVNTMELCLI